MAQGKSELFGVLVNSNNAEYYLRFKVSLYQGGILRVMIDDVNVVHHKRFRTSTTMGFEYQSLKPENFTVKFIDDEKIVIEAES